MALDEETMPDVEPGEPGERPELKWVPVDAIVVDSNYQRGLRMKRVRQILREFKWAMFEPVMLADKGDGTFAVYDGQHRVKAAQLHPAVSDVPALVVSFERAREEAGAFLGVNVNRTSVTTIERYWAGLEAGDPDMMRVCAVLDDAECDVVQGLGLAAPDKTAAVTSVLRACKYYGDGPVVSALKVLRNAWPEDKTALHGTLIMALARLFKANKNIDQSRLVEVLQATDRQSLTVDAEAMRKISGGDPATNICRAVVAHYNRGRKSEATQILIGAKA